MTPLPGGGPSRLAAGLGAMTQMIDEHAHSDIDYGYGDGDGDGDGWGEGY